MDRKEIYDVDLHKETFNIFCPYCKAFMSDMDISTDHLEKCRINRIIKPRIHFNKMLNKYLKENQKK